MSSRLSWLLPSLVAGLVGLGLAACGNSSGGAAGATPQGEFLTADAQGLTGDITLAGPGGTGTPTTFMNRAAEMADDLEQELEEADLYRVQDQYLFLVNSYRGLVIVDLAEQAIVGRLATSGFPQELLLLGSRALVVLERSDGSGAVLDVSLATLSAPELRATLPLAGQPLTSRRDGDQLLTVARNEQGTTLQSFRIGADLEPLGTLALPGLAEHLHVGPELVFLTHTEVSSTRVRLVDHSDAGGALTLRGSLLVPGTVLDDEKLHFGGGTFRLVTRDVSEGLSSRLSVVDVSNPDAPFVRGELQLGQGEQLFATRFDEFKAYVVTFEVVDPLWVIDLSNPDAPTVTAELIVPGWSSQLVVLPDRLVALGMEPTGGWHTTVSLFDVSDPAAPLLSSRVHLSSAGSPALGERRAFGVFPAEGLVLVPMSGPTAHLAVLDLGADSLTLRGAIETTDEPRRGFPTALGLCALTDTRVVLADADDLDATVSITIAEDVVDQARLAPAQGGTGRLVKLVQDGAVARLGAVELPLGAERVFQHGKVLAVTGWDALGRAAYVLDYRNGAPVVSPRLDIGSPSFGALPIGPTDVGLVWHPGPGFFGTDTLFSGAGRLVVRGTSDAPADLTLGSGELQDGFVVLNLVSGAIESRIEVRGFAVTGAALDGEALGLTLGRSGGLDDEGRPLMRHGFRRIDLPTRTITATGGVPGSLIALAGERVFTLEEQWSDGWTVQTNVVAAQLGIGGTQVLARRELPAGSYDLRAAGATLYYTASTGDPAPGGGLIAMPWMPPTDIHTLHLDAALTPGPSIDIQGEFVSLLLAEESGALVVRNGMTVQRFDLSGPTAQLQWSRDIGIFPRTARADGPGGSYLLALGLGGSISVP